MSSDQYLRNVLSTYQVNPNLAEQYKSFFEPYIREWAKDLLVDLKVSGSIRKGTAVSNGTDVDLFISLSSTTNETLGEIYNLLFDYLQGKGFSVRKQNVSIGVNYNSEQIDLVPAKRQSQYGNDHSLYVSKKNTWTKTNIETHISKVSNSGRLEEIKLTKIWRNNNNLDFPSFYLELLVIDALSNCRRGDLANNFWQVLNFIALNIKSKVYMDPSNTNNCISDQIPLTTKEQIARKASESISKQYWSHIIS
ncbi:hypothetical protein OB962_00920 [Aeromonas piscicola]|uniref:Nucleotidyltransferase n=1 Tax=Aeromonas piscicola TaxID=600645 RepID=A0ABT7Q6K1_9GAMM|nr:hypothetical protein [Aeromonas piscicola]MDM5129565.1 hypothetical protein [Aeromonas piscicola]